jgi:hypothetical protein
MQGYSLLLASDVLERDRLGLALYDSDDHQLAEIFRDDELGTVTFTALVTTGIPFAVLQWYSSEAERRL